MNTTQKKEDKGTQGVNASQTKTNGKPVTTEALPATEETKPPVKPPAMKGTGKNMRRRSIRGIRHVKILC